MIFLLIVGILCIDRIKLKLVGDDKFLGMSGGKVVKTDYKNALPIKLNICIIKKLHIYLK